MNGKILSIFIKNDIKEKTMGFADYVTKLSKNDEWYTPQHAVEVILPYIPKGSKVWCPFDLPESQYVKVLSGGVLT